MGEGRLRASDRLTTVPRRATPFDIPRLSWVVALAFASRGKRLHRTVALLTVAPYFLTYFVYAVAGEVFTDERRETVLIVARARFGLRALARGFGFLLLLAAVVLVGAGVLLGLEWAVAGLPVEAALSALAVAVVVTGVGIVALLASLVVTVAQSAGSLPGVFEAMAYRPPGPRWNLSGLARDPRAMRTADTPFPAFSFVEHAIAGAVPPGSWVVATAIDDRVRRLYERRGFRRIAPASFTVARAA